ncbi:hypothetical protein [Mycolicibacterium llatzerense]|uniref:Uncharacterized protein n=1 Tax=Mycolicibacterium llatzerense TaxID=280871 RepID=A0A0D1LP68_9MYCO|nr:hypothetical protein [Mycolicibacterium llatzerense]KIU17881.1 hypothetical protein TL10_06380 [Mycolicibacterium llatzerense]
MSTTSVAISIGSRGEEQFEACESGNYFVEDTSPVSDATNIRVHLDEFAYVTMTVGQWKALVGAVYLGIEAIPAKRQQRLEREARSRALVAQAAVQS